jgi:hypothetical protein
MQFKDLWDLESAMKVLQHDTVESKLWAEAVEWLMLYGPPEIQQLLLEASATATNSSFPGLTPTHFSTNGEPVYNTKELAESLGIPEEEVKKILAEKETAHGAGLLTPYKTNETVH